mgnify:CR=1 FL=1
MKLARIVKWDDRPWWLHNRGRINPPIGTIVQYEHDGERVEVYFPGCVAGSSMNMKAFNVYFEDLTDANS